MILTELKPIALWYSFHNLFCHSSYFRVDVHDGDDDDDDDNDDG